MTTKRFGNKTRSLHTKRAEHKHDSYVHYYDILLLASTAYLGLRLMLAFIIGAILPYSEKKEATLEITFPVNEQNVSVVYIDINAISLCLDLNIFQQDECVCSKL